MATISNRILRAWAGAAVLAAAVAGPAAAGNGAVSYENPMKIEQQKKRAKAAADAPPQAAPAPAKSAPASVATPAGAATVGKPASDADRNAAYATSLRRDLTEDVTLAEEQIANGTDARLKAVAERILETRRKELAELDRWSAEHSRAASK